MGALPSRETHQRGLYSHRHGRNRRSEIILIPLTSAFFPSPDCPLFRHLYNARFRRTAKYYYRALRSSEASRESDYFCTSTRLSEPEEFNKFNEERLAKQREARARGEEGRKPSAFGGGSTDAASAREASGHSRPPAVDDYNYQSFTDTLEGLYHVLITENDLCMYDTDEQLREAYAQQVAHQRREWEKMSKRFMRNAANTASNPMRGIVPEMPSTFERVPYDAFLSGYAAARQYMKGRRLHTWENRDVVEGDTDADADEDKQKKNSISGGGCNGSSSPNGNKSERSSAGRRAKYCRHVTSPAAYCIHPIPCAIASRWDATKPAPVNDPLYVPFEGFYVKIMGMFGVFPSTVVMRSEEYEEGSGAAPRPFPRKEGNQGGAGDGDGDGAAYEVEQHLLKGTMFIDKDVGDQILGNMVMLATHMYVRQSVRARIQPRYLPMMPFFMRFPLSNIPMLQFVREFRIRVRTLLEAGTAKSGQKPMHVGMSGFNPMDIAEVHDQQKARLGEEGYLFEDDIPDVLSDPGKLFMGVEEAQAVSFTSLRTSMDTNEGGRFPILMLSGFNVQNTPLRHPALNETGHRPASAPALAHHAPPPQRKPSSTGAGGHTAATTQTTAAAPPPPRFPSASGSWTTTVPAGGTAADGHRGSPTTPANAPPPVAQSSTVASEAYKTMLLTRRKNRFRMWIEDGHVCIWASAAYARRACLIIAQQLNTTVDSHGVPEQRAWMLRGLLHAGAVVPRPLTANDVLVVAEDIPSAGLWQGDVLRCSTKEECSAMQARQPLPLPCRSAPDSQPPGSPSSPCSATSPTGLKAPSTEAGNNGAGAIGSALHGDDDGSKDNSTVLLGSISLDSPLTAGVDGAGGSLHFVGNGASSPLLQEQQQAPENAFWVRAAGGLDDSYTNISDSNVPPNPKMIRQLQQAAQQRAKKLTAAAAALNRLYADVHGKGSGGGSLLSALIAGSHNGDSSAATAAAAAALAISMASDFLEIDRREGTLHLEEVVLSWMRVVLALSRESSSEAEGDWVRDPLGNPVRIDRFVFRRVTFEGARLFIGVTPRFVGQQRRIEKVLGEVYAMERRESKQQQQSLEEAGAGASAGALGAFGGAGVAGRRKAAEDRKKLAGLPMESQDDNDDDDEEDYDDVLERMGFGPSKLREALEQSTRAKGSNPITGLTSGSATHPPSQPIANAGGVAGTDEVSDLLSKFERQQYHLMED